MDLNARIKWTSIAAAALFVSGCVSGAKVPDDGSSELIDAPPVQPAQIGEDECVNYVQLKRDAEYLCELSNGETRPMRQGERRSSPLTREEIVEVIERNSEDSDACIGEAVKTDPKAKGKVVIEFEVEPDGKISAVEYLREKSTYKNEKLGQCLTGKIKNWRFPVLHNDDSLEIKFPFTIDDTDLSDGANDTSQTGAQDDPTNTSSRGSSGQGDAAREVPNKKTIKKTRKN
jgi:hypothetical protein